MVMVSWGLSASPVLDSALPSWILTHHLPPLSPVRSNWMVAFVLPARAGSRAEGICSKTMFGVTWSALISVICSSWWDDAVRHRFTHDIGLGENHRSGGGHRA